MTSGSVLPFAAFRGQAAQRTVIDHRLTWRQRDDVGVAIETLAADLSRLRRTVHAAVIRDLAALIVTCRDVDQAAAWLDSMGRGSEGDLRVALYVAALKLRQITEV